MSARVRVKVRMWVMVRVWSTWRAVTAGTDTVASARRTYPNTE